MLVPKFTMRAALEDNNLLGRAMPGDSWRLWRTLLIASRGEQLTPDERKLLWKVTKRARAPHSPVDEMWIIAGRRGGKSRAEAVLAVYYSALCEHSYLAPGEEAVALVIAPDTDQSSTILKYATAIFELSPMLSKLVRNETSDTIELTHRASIQVRASSFRRRRGKTYCVVVCDEAAFYYTDDSANPDTEILRAIRPGPLTSGGPLIVASSPYARRGELHNAYDRHFGNKGDRKILVAQGSTYDFNPLANKAVVEKAYSQDPVSARAEYGGEFRSDIEQFLTKEAVEAVTARGVRERAPRSDLRYWAFADPSGGSGDSFTLAIGHRDNQRCIIDVLRERRPPFSPEGVVKEYSELLKSYRIHSLRGDAYAGMWPKEQFAKRGIQYSAHSKPKSELYLSLLSSINSETVELLDNQRLTDQLTSLERRTSRQGRDSIDHPPNGKDDCANAIAGVTHEVLVNPVNRITEHFAAPIIVRGAR